MIHKVFQDTLKEVGEKKSNTEENLAVCFLLCINLRVLGGGLRKRMQFTLTYGLEILLHIH